MLPIMIRRSILVRCLALVWATLQLASPGISAIADGRLSSESQPVAHIEATSSASCPVVHAPDCGVCRYLSNAAVKDAPAAFFGCDERARGNPSTQNAGVRGVALALPRGRAPPLS
jgi:hypothetical protein